MPIEPIRRDILPVRRAIAALEGKADRISGPVVLVCENNDEDYDFYVAGVVGAERTIGRLEVIKQALLRKLGLY